MPKLCCAKRRALQAWRALPSCRPERSSLQTVSRRGKATNAIRELPGNVFGLAGSVFMRELQTTFGVAVTTNKDIVLAHGKGESFHKSAPPDAVLFAESTEDVARAVRLCHEHHMPVIPFGVGTSLEGHVAALHGGLSIDMSHMNEVLEVNAEDMDCRLQAGVTRNQLNEYLRQSGLFFPIDPGADATIGGMSATGASGTNAVRYGTMRENVLGLTVVTSGGEIIRTGGRARKSSAGYDLTRLFVGSEGTLGIITEIQLKLHGRPPAISGAVAPFDDLAGAVQAVIEIFQMGIAVARCELLDEVSMAAMNSFSHTNYQVKPTLFLEFHGTTAGVEEQATLAKEIAMDCGARSYDWSRDPEERRKLWAARHNAYYAAMALRPGCKGQPTDVCVPISRLAQCILETAQDVEAHGLVAPIFGHVGDGNFHVILTHHPDDPAELVQTTADVNKRLIERALAMGGTCTGEHGVGYGKLPYMVQQHGQGTIDMMRAIKVALDPTGIMNPGKVVSV